MTNNGRQSCERSWPLWRAELDLDVGSQAQISDRKKPHATLADVDPDRIHGGKLRNHTNGGVQELPLSSAAVLPGEKSGKHKKKESESLP